VPINHVLIRDNTMIGSFNGVRLEGEVHKVLVVGNRIKDSRTGAIELTHLLPGTEDILAANNTMYKCDAAVTIWDDHAKGKDFLKCKNIRVQNNLVFETDYPADMVFSDQRRNIPGAIGPGDMKSLLSSPSKWHFGHNWREVDPMRANAQAPDRWIPFSPTDHPVAGNPVLSYKPDDPDFLRPPKDSPLATGGAGVSDIPLPAYVGAVPPEGVEPWDWEKTWNAMTR
jgi:hypothetical protein